MANEHPMNDPRNIWQNQTTEAFKMSADELRSKAQRRRRKSRFEAVYSMILGFILFVAFARMFAGVQEIVPRIGWGLLSLWCIYFVYQAYKWFWTDGVASDATLNTTLQAYRRALENRRDYLLHIGRRAGLAFCFLGVAMVTAPALVKAVDDPRLLLNVAPIFVLLAIWLAIFLPTRKRNQRKLQQEIEELRRFERENFDSLAAGAN